ncbi:hypothetical protein LCGC14_2671240, partial [marine sediment metagenome]
SGDVYACAYGGLGSDGFVVTFTIDSSGNIGNAVIDSLEFDSTYAYQPSLTFVSDDIFAVAYQATAPVTSGKIKTFTITSSGFFSSVLGTLEFESAQMGYFWSHIILITGSTIVCVGYQGVDGDGFVKTALIEGPTPPTVTTQAVSSIEGTTATGNGNITDLGSPNPTAHGVCWNTTGSPTTSDDKTDEGTASSTGAFTTNMTSLSLGTLYYVRAYATNTVGTAYGDEVTFTAATAPVVTTQAVTSILETTATGNGNVTDLGNGTVSQHGHCWATSTNPTTSDSKTENGAKGSTGAFTSSITGLSTGVTYFVRAYATNSEIGTSYGDNVTFQADHIPVLVTDASTDVTGTTATGQGNIVDLGGDNATAHGHCWDTSADPTTSDSSVDNGAASSIGAFTSSITGLSAGTLYYVRAYATNTVGTGYGGNVSFIASAPTVITLTCED